MKQHTDATIDIRNDRTRSRSSGINGAAFGISRLTSSTRDAADTTSNAPPDHGDDGSRSLPSTKAANMIALSVMLPTSRARRALGGRGNPAQAASTSAPIGRFTANSHGQLATDSKPAPTAGPAAEAPAIASAFHAIA